MAFPWADVKDLGMGMFGLAGVIYVSSLALSRSRTGGGSNGRSEAVMATALDNNTRAMTANTEAITDLRVALADKLGGMDAKIDQLLRRPAAGGGD